MLLKILVSICVFNGVMLLKTVLAKGASSYLYKSRFQTPVPPNANTDAHLIIPTFSNRPTSYLSDDYEYQFNVVPCYQVPRKHPRCTDEGVLPAEARKGQARSRLCE